MTLDFINRLIAEEDFKGLVERIKKTRPNDDWYQTIKKQYDVKDHAIFDKTKRKDTPIENDKNELVDTSPVTRLGFPLQKKIVQTAAAFLCGNPIILDASPKNEAEISYLELPHKVWDDNKLDYKNLFIAETEMSETECAELWYNPPAEENYWEGTSMKSQYKLKMRILANSFGDTLYPVFDATGDMIAFCRGYNVEDEEGKKIEYFDIYTDKQIIKTTKDEVGWSGKKENNIVGKIPVIYYSQKEVEWADVQTSIERFETTASNHPDTNDYNGSPTLFGTGTFSSMPKKESMGKFVMGEVGSDIRYVTWEQAPESIKMELDNEWKWIHTHTDTPDISFESMKSLGTTPSGYAMELMFMSAHLKAARKAVQGYGESIQRRINYIKAWLAAMDRTQAKFLTVSIKPKFEYFLPKNIAEKVDILNNAKTGGLISDETAVRQMPSELVQDPDNEIELLKGQNTLEKELDDEMNDKGGIIKPIKTGTGQ